MRDIVGFVILFLFLMFIMEPERLGKTVGQFRNGFNSVLATEPK